MIIFIPKEFEQEARKALESVGFDNITIENEDASEKVHFLKKKRKIEEILRWEIWERDNFTCKHCGSRKNLQIDHIFPESKGGGLEPDNLQTLCKDCNVKKGSKIL